MAEKIERRATVICLAVSGKGNKIFKKGTVVTEASFPEGGFAEKVKSGHLLEAKPQEKLLSIEDAKADAKIKHAAAEKSEREKAVKEASELGVEFTDEMNSDAINVLIKVKKVELETKALIDATISNLKQVCDKYEIEYATDVDVDTLEKLISEYESKNVKSFVNSKGETVQVKSIDDITTKELQTELDKAKSPFDKSAKKPSLYAQWLELK